VRALQVGFVTKQSGVFLWVPVHVARISQLPALLHAALNDMTEHFAHPAAWFLQSAVSAMIANGSRFSNQRLQLLQFDVAKGTCMLSDSRHKIKAVLTGAVREEMLRMYDASVVSGAHVVILDAGLHSVPVYGSFDDVQLVLAVRSMEMRGCVDSPAVGCPTELDRDSRICSLIKGTSRKVFFEHVPPMESARGIWDQRISVPTGLADAIMNTQAEVADSAVRLHAMQEEEPQFYEDDFEHGLEARYLHASSITPDKVEAVTSLSAMEDLHAAAGTPATVAAATLSTPEPELDSRITSPSQQDASHGEQMESADSMRASTAGSGNASHVPVPDNVSMQESIQVHLSSGSSPDLKTSAGTSAPAGASPSERRSSLLSPMMNIFQSFRGCKTT
jgi:hypothetical protein